MKYHLIEMEGVRTLKPFSLDLDSFGPSIIAVAGRNGAGKTSFLEAIGPGLLFRKLPSRATSKVESQFETGTGRVKAVFTVGDHRYTAEIRCKNGNVIASLECPSKGLSVSGKMGDYDAAIKATLGTLDAYCASVYGIQGGAGRLSSLSGPARKDVFQHYLNLGRAQKLHSATKDRLKAISAEAEKLKHLREDLPTLEAAIGMIEAELPKLRAEIPKARAAVEAARAELASLQAAEQKTKAYRVWSDRLASLQDSFQRTITDGAPLKSQIAEIEAKIGSLGNIPEDPIDPAWFSEQRKKLDEITKASAKLDIAKDSVTKTGRDLLRIKGQAQRLCEVPCGGEGEFASCPLIADATAARNLIPEVEEELANLTGCAETLAGKVGDPTPIRKALAKAEAEDRAEADLRAKKASFERSLELARERLVSLRKRYKELEAEIKEHEAAEPEKPADATSTSAARAALAEADASVDALVRREASLKQDLANKNATLEKVKKALDASGDVATEVDELTLLERALGPNGIQAAEIGAAGPEISQMATQLLGDAFGGRFSVSIKVDEGRKQGAGSIEDVKIMVADEMKGGAERDLGDTSGGQQVVIDEAIRTALATFANERNDVPFRTLWRDESAGALDPENAAHYIAMLREARSIGRYHHIFFVAQQPEVYEAADKILWIEDGEITVRVMR